MTLARRTPPQKNDHVSTPGLTNIRTTSLKAHHREPSRIRILIVDDHPLVRDGLQTLLAAQPDFVVVGAASDGVEALRMAAALEPDVLLLDMSMPGLSGLEVVQEMNSAETPLNCRTILLTAANRSQRHHTRAAAGRPRRRAETRADGTGLQEHSQGPRRRGVDRS
jgi:CheY-like chemotaxis protein